MFTQNNQCHRLVLYAMYFFNLIEISKCIDNFNWKLYFIFRLCLMKNRRLVTTILLILKTPSNSNLLLLPVSMLWSTAYTLLAYRENLKAIICCQHVHIYENDYITIYINAWLATKYCMCLKRQPPQCLLSGFLICNWININLNDITLNFKNDR